jgi:hypothetical protein
MDIEVSIHHPLVELDQELSPHNLRIHAMKSNKHGSSDPKKLFACASYSVLCMKKCSFCSYHDCRGNRLKYDFGSTVSNHYCFVSVHSGSGHISGYKVLAPDQEVPKEEISFNYQ